MFKILFFFFVTVFSLHAKSTDIPLQTRNNYASNMYNGFILQSQGKSNSAFFQFDSAREEAKKAGENPLKIAVAEQLFYWYRKYGTALNLFHKNPEGRERIIDEYKPRGYHSRGNNPYEGYKSEWGKTPEQAARVRDFMLSIGEIIAGIFFVTVPTPYGAIVVTCLWSDGFTRMFNSLNYLWAEHEAMTYLKNCEKTAENAMKQE